MKQIELNLQKRLLIVEVPEGESGIKRGVKFICKGSQLTEEITKVLVGSPDNFQFLDAENTFIGEIEQNGYYWNSVPWDFPLVEDYGYQTSSSQEVERGWMFEGGKEKYHEELAKYNEAESRTFTPERTLIFEIL